MILVADAFHVMTSNRPYQRSRTRTEAMEELVRRAGTQFCPRVVAMVAALRNSRADVDGVLEHLRSVAPKLPTGNRPD